MFLFRKKAITEFDATKENMVKLFTKMKSSGAKVYFDPHGKYLLQDDMLITGKTINSNTIWNILKKTGDDFFFRQVETFSILDDNNNIVDFLRVYEGKDFREYRVDSIDLGDKELTDEEQISLKAIQSFKEKYNSVSNTL